MNAFFFSPDKNIIKHTLSNADEVITPKHEILSAGTEVILLDTGVIKFEPNTACDTSIVVSCGIHGNETAPIEIVSKIVSDLLAEEEKCSQRVLFIFGNPWAMAASERFIDVNMNRLFCGDWQYQDLTLKEVKRAAKLEAYVANFFAEEPVTAVRRYHYDCHTAIRDSARERFAVYPYVPHRKLPDKQKSFLAQADIHTVLLQQKEANTFSSFTSLKHKAESFTLELGKAKPFGENELGRFSGIDNALRKLISGDVLVANDDDEVDSFDVCHSIINTNDTWQFHVAEDVANFTEFSPNTLIWEDNETAYRVGSEPEYIVFPNSKVPVGQRAGLMLKKQTKRF